MKKIAFFFPAGVFKIGGVERVTSIISSYLSKNNDVYIISYYEGTPQFDIDNNVKFINLGMSLSKFSLLRKIKPALYLFKLKMIFKKYDFDIIFPIGDTTNIMALLSKSHDEKIFSIVHNSFYESLSLQGMIFRRFFLNHVDKLIISNKTDVQEYKKLVGEIPVVYIPNPLSYEINDTSSYVNKMIISAGRLTSVKGFDNLIRVFSIINKKHPDWSLNIFGEDHGMESRLLELIDELNLKDCVRLKGKAYDMKQEYINSSLYVSSSNIECFGMVILEAQQMGLPVVAFDCNSGPRDLVNHGENGFLVPLGNLNEMAQCICSLIEDRHKLISFGSSSKQNSSSYGREKILPLWDEIITTN